MYIAAKVGKPESYVKGRLFLTNLTDAAAKAYRKGELPDSFAVVIAKLSPANQAETIKYVKNDYRDVDLNDLKTFIQDKFSNPLAFQPWLKDAAVAKAVGPCKECPPNREDLFGKSKDGQCTDLKCWRRKMAAYIASVKEAQPYLALVSSNYGKPETPWAIGKSDYHEVEGKKDHCDFMQDALVIEGDGIGKTLKICASTECEDHHPQRTEYTQSPKEKERRKKEQEKEVAKRQKFDDAIGEALEKVAWPLSAKHLDALLDITLGSMGTNSLMPILKRHGLKAEVTLHSAAHYKTRDCAGPLRKFSELHGNDSKLAMIFELHLGSYNSYSDTAEMIKRIPKL
jgi:hypothetical protein